MKLRRVLFSILLIFIVIMFSVARAEPSVGSVVWVKGTIKAIQHDKTERILQKNSPIYLKDTLVTDAKSKAQIVFTDRTLMTFRESTQFHITEYQYKPKEKGSVGKYIMNLLEGGFRTITGAIAKRNPSDYQINTPVATIGVRGTDYTVYIHKGQLYMAQYQGTPCVNSGGGSLCLNEHIKFTHVPSRDTLPIPLHVPPTVFKEKLEVIPASVVSPPVSETPAATPPPSPGESNQSDPTKGSEGTVDETKNTVKDTVEITQGKVSEQIKEINSEIASEPTDQKTPLSTSFCIQ